MKKIKHFIVQTLDSGTDTIRTFCMKLCERLSQFPKREEPVSPPETVDDIFLREWTLVLTENARVFSGLYNGLKHVQSGNAKKPEKILREWSQRTHDRWENESVDILCQKQIVPLIEAEDRENLIKWACLLLDAAGAAGIMNEETEILVLTEENADAYMEWDGNALYPEDEIEVIIPAWYQNGRVLEQGRCRKLGQTKTETVQPQTDTEAEPQSKPHARTEETETSAKTLKTVLNQDVTFGRNGNGETAEVVLCDPEHNYRKVIVNYDGFFADFPGIVQGRWTRYLKGKFDFDAGRVCFRTSFEKQGDGYRCLWEIQPDGRYWADEDGFGAENDFEIILYADLDARGVFKESFRIYTIDGRRAEESDEKNDSIYSERGNCSRCDQFH